MKKTEQSIFEHAHRAEGFWQRLRGLMFFKSYPYEEALLFENCNAIHTLFLRFPIDVIFLNKEKTILKISHGLRPWRLCFCKGAYYVIETPTGTAISWSAPTS